MAILVLFNLIASTVTSCLFIGVPRVVFVFLFVFFCFLGQPLMPFVSPVLSLFLVRLPPVSAVTPLQANQFAWELRCHPDRQKVNFVVDGIHHGFQLGFPPSQKLKSAKYNKPSAAQHPSVVDQYLAIEVSLGRVAGPFSVPPHPNLHFGSFGVIPKRSQPGK